jgi:hypothetical protein
MLAQAAAGLSTTGPRRLFKERVDLNGCVGSRWAGIDSDLDEEEVKVRGRRDMPRVPQIRRIIFNDEEIGMGFNSDSGLAVGTALQG